MQKVRIELIENKGPATLGNEFETQTKLEKVKIGVAFIDKKERIEHLPLNKWLKNRCNIQILTRISKEAFTGPDALEKLYELQKKYGKNKIEIRISEDLGFHEKLYIFKKKRTVTTYVGSSNLTSHGLWGSGEINVKIVGNKNSEVIDQAIENFDSFWNTATSLEDKRILDAYLEYYGDVHKPKNAAQSRGWKKLAKLIKPKKSKRNRTPFIGGVWFEWFTDYFTKKQNSIIRQELRGQRKEAQDYFSTLKTRYQKYKLGDIIISASFKNKKKKVYENTIEAAIITDKTILKKRGLGKYFILHRKNGRSRTISKKLLKKLKDGGAITKASEKNLKRNVKLPKKRASAFAKILKFKI